MGFFGKFDTMKKELHAAENGIINKVKCLWYGHRYVMRNVKVGESRSWQMICLRCGRVEGLYRA